MVVSGLVLAARHRLAMRDIIPEGIRVGGESRQGRAVKVWDKRQFRNLDGSVELGTRNVKVALKRLRAFARTGAEEELDLDDTIQSTARNAGMLDIKMIPERHNAVKVLIFIDVGGSMYPYVQSCEELFSAARSEFKHLDYFYFHNFIYDFVWKDNRRRNSEVTATWDVLHKYARDYRVIFVGDASMAPYEIASPGETSSILMKKPVRHGCSGWRVPMIDWPGLIRHLNHIGDTPSPSIWSKSWSMTACSR